MQGLVVVAVHSWLHLDTGRVAARWDPEAVASNLANVMHPGRVRRSSLWLLRQPRSSSFNDRSPRRE